MKRIYRKNYSTIVLTFLALMFPRLLPAYSLKPVVELDHPVVMAKEKGVVYMLVRFEVAEIKEDPAKPRPRLNLAIVIDRSGSMSGQGKMDYAKTSSKMLVDSMKPTDRLAIVEYDDQITVPWPSAPVESPEMIKRQIDKLRPRGSTNLTGGMMKGADEILKSLDRNTINRVVLLSDGLANTGVTNPIEIKRLVREASRKGVKITTMGLGTDYNEDLMQAIAENAAGNYYYIESPTQMSRIFKEELGTLFTTVAKEVTMTFEPTAAVSKVDVLGYVATQNEAKTKIEMEGFYSGEKRSFLIRLEVKPKKTGKVKLGRLELAYFDMVDRKSKAIENTIFIKASLNPEDVMENEKMHVVVESTLVEADKSHERFVRMYEKGRKREALREIKVLAGDLEKRNKRLSDVKIAKKIEALKMEAEEMRQADRNRRHRSSYLKKSKQRFYGAKRGKRGKSLLQEGDSGNDVKRLQRALDDEGLYRGPINGRFTSELADAVKKYQRSKGLIVDGVAGPATMKGLQLY
ncbi:MAG: VWA domain-containing protein [Proteobacteria bacterium]|nr:VWA domain-containing protein [Pseudomonadota bacterium]